jgi:hypothetical protein
VVRKKHHPVAAVLRGGPLCLRGEIKSALIFMAAGEIVILVFVLMLQTSGLFFACVSLFPSAQG